MIQTVSLGGVISLFAFWQWQQFMDTSREVPPQVTNVIGKRPWFRGVMFLRLPKWQFLSGVSGKGFAQLIVLACCLFMANTYKVVPSPLYMGYNPINYRYITYKP